MALTITIVRREAFRPVTVNINVTPYILLDGTNISEKQSASFFSGYNNSLLLLTFLLATVWECIYKKLWCPCTKYHDITFYQTQNFIIHTCYYCGIHLSVQRINIRVAENHIQCFTYVYLICVDLIDNSTERPTGCYTCKTT
jgi:hypothetical protein